MIIWHCSGFDSITCTVIIIRIIIVLIINVTGTFITVITFIWVCLFHVFLLASAVLQGASNGSHRVTQTEAAAAGLHGTHSLRTVSYHIHNIPRSFESCGRESPVPACRGYVTERARQAHMRRSGGYLLPFYRLVNSGRAINGTFPWRNVSEFMVPGDGGARSVVVVPSFLGFYGSACRAHLAPPGYLIVLLDVRCLSWGSFGRRASTRALEGGHGRSCGGVGMHRVFSFFQTGI